MRRWSSDDPLDACISWVFGLSATNPNRLGKDWERITWEMARDVPDDCFGVQVKITRSPSTVSSAESNPTGVVHGSYVKWSKRAVEDDRPEFLRDLVRGARSGGPEARKVGSGSAGKPSGKSSVGSSARVGDVGGGRRREGGGGGEVGAKARGSGGGNPETSGAEPSADKIRVAALAGEFLYRTLYMDPRGASFLGVAADPGATVTVQYMIGPIHRVDVRTGTIEGGRGRRPGELARTPSGSSTADPRTRRTEEEDETEEETVVGDVKTYTAVRSAPTGGEGPYAGDTEFDPSKHGVAFRHNENPMVFGAVSPENVDPAKGWSGIIQAVHRQLEATCARLFGLDAGTLARASALAAEIDKRGEKAAVADGVPKAEIDASWVAAARCMALSNSKFRSFSVVKRTRTIYESVTRRAVLEAMLAAFSAAATVWIGDADAAPALRMADDVRIIIEKTARSGKAQAKTTALANATRRWFSTGPRVFPWKFETPKRAMCFSAVSSEDDPDYDAAMATATTWWPVAETAAFAGLGLRSVESLVPESIPSRLVSSMRSSAARSGEPGFVYDVARYVAEREKEIIDRDIVVRRGSPRTPAEKAATEAETVAKMYAIMTAVPVVRTELLSDLRAKYGKRLCGAIADGRVDDFAYGGSDVVAYASDERRRSDNAAILSFVMRVFRKTRERDWAGLFGTKARAIARTETIDKPTPPTGDSGRSLELLCVRELLSGYESIDPADTRWISGECANLRRTAAAGVAGITVDDDVPVGENDDGGRTEYFVKGGILAEIGLAVASVCNDVSALEAIVEKVCGASATTSIEEMARTETPKATTAALRRYCTEARMMRRIVQRLVARKIAGPASDAPFAKMVGDVVRHVGVLRRVVLRMAEKFGEHSGTRNLALVVGALAATDCAIGSIGTDFARKPDELAASAGSATSDDPSAHRAIATMATAVDANFVGPKMTPDEIARSKALFYECTCALFQRWNPVLGAFSAQGGKKYKIRDTCDALCAMMDATEDGDAVRKSLRR